MFTLITHVIDSKKYKMITDGRRILVQIYKYHKPLVTQLSEALSATKLKPVMSRDDERVSK